MTIFQKIIDREIPATIVHEDEHTLAFRDLNPQAPVHVLVIPKRAIDRVSSAEDGDAEVLGRVLLAARDVARKEGLEKAGYRLVINNGPAAGQTVEHVHVHVLGGRDFRWPPG